MPTLTDIFTAIADPIGTATRASDAAIAALKAKAQAWAREVVTLYNMPVPANLLPQKKALLARANTIRKMVEAIFGPLVELKNVQLGYVVVVGAAAVAAAVAAITYWLTDFGKFKLEVQRQADANKHVQQLVSQGVPLDVATASVAKDESKSLFERFIGDPKQILLPAVGISIAGYFIYKYFLNKKR